MPQTETAEIEIRPALPEFLDLMGTFPRVPLVSQKKIQSLNPGRLFQYLFKNTADCFLLESGKGPESIARYSFFGNARGAPLKVSAGDSTSLASVLEQVGFSSSSAAFPYIDHFWGGWVGYFSYETVRFLEKIQFRKKTESDLPDVYLIETDTLFVYDQVEKILKCIVTLPGDRCDSANYHLALEVLNSWWERIDAFLELPAEEPLPCPAENRAHLKSNMSRADYVLGVERARRYIEEGDVYQANLAQRFQVPCREDPHALYARLQKLNPSPFGGIFKMDRAAIVSSSPERLVKIDRHWIETRPIAGTRPRGADSCEDTRLSEELLLNQKERAEHLMLVDLERNDLGRLCESGTVHVSDFMFREEYSHVHHIVSNVAGNLRPNLSLLEILQAVFPGGTITGCPKIRCMEIIDELEPDPRGPYCGSLGYIGYGPYLDLNILIRTILLDGGTAWFHAGAGIVADSIPEQEYEETLNKAAAMLLALTGKASATWT